MYKPFGQQPVDRRCHYINIPTILNFLFHICIVCYVINAYTFPQTRQIRRLRVAQIVFEYIHNDCLSAITTSVLINNIMLCELINTVD